MRTQHTLHSIPQFPVYCAGFVSDTRLVVGGGGGTGRSGIKNKLRLYDVDKATQNITLVTEAEMELGEDSPTTLVVNREDSSLICGVNSSEQSVAEGINEHCRLYQVADDKLSVTKKKQTLSPDLKEAYQNVTAFSRDSKLVAVGTSNNEVVVLSYPSLAVVSNAFKIPSGTLYGLDFSESTLLVTTSTTLYFIPLPLNMVAVPDEASEPDAEVTHKLALASLEPSTTLSVPGLDVLSASEDGGLRTFRAGRFNTAAGMDGVLYTVVNSAPQSGRGSKKADRKSFLVRWERQQKDEKEEKEAAEKWLPTKVRFLGKRAVTVFATSENGKLLAYGASDSSVGILDARTFAPLLAILKSHDFPPTLLQFNPSATVLVSGSADASLRVILVPELFSSSSTLMWILLLLLAVLAVVGAVALARP